MRGEQGREPAHEEVAKTTEVQLPQGGYLAWADGDFTYVTSRIMEEVSARYL